MPSKKRRDRQKRRKQRLYNKRKNSLKKQENLCNKKITLVKEIIIDSTIASYFNINEIIEKIWKEYYDHNIAIEHSFDLDDGVLAKITIHGTAVMSIQNGMTWYQIKRAISDKQNYVKNQSRPCDICCEEDSISKVSCNFCSNRYCNECYIKLYVSGKGIIKCPFCRHSYGHRVPQNMIKFGVMQIRLNMNSI